MANKSFNKNMGSYLDKIKESKKNKEKKRFKLNLDWLKTEEEKVPEVKKGEVHIEYNRPSKWDKLFSFRRKIIKESNYNEDLSPEEMAKLKGMEDDVEDTEKAISKDEQRIEEIHDDEQVLVEKREGLLSNLFSKLKFKRTPMNDNISKDQIMGSAEEVHPKLDDDIKEAFKVAHKWIDQLTPAKKRSFKASKDFQTYKIALEKYGLIKKK